MIAKTSIPCNWNFEITNLWLHYNYPMEIWGIIKNAMLEICGILLYLHVGPKMDPYTYEHTHCIYGFGQPCLTLLTTCMKVTYDKYNTTWTDETSINNLFCNNFTTTILDFHAITQLLTTIMVIIIIIISLA